MTKFPIVLKCEFTPDKIFNALCNKGIDAEKIKEHSHWLDFKYGDKNGQQFVVIDISLIFVVVNRQFLQQFCNLKVSANQRIPDCIFLSKLHNQVTISILDHCKRHIHESL